MRLAFPMFGVGRSGGSKVIARLADASIRRGHSVSFLVPAQKGVPSPGTPAEIIQVPRIPIPRDRHIVPTIMSGASFQYAKRLRGFDAVVASYGPTCLPTKLAGDRNLKRYYIVQHDETIFFPPLTLEHWVVRLSYSAFEQGRVFAVSKWLQDMVRKRGGPQPILLPPGIDHETYRPRVRTPHEGKRVLALARDDKWRGFRVFLAAMESVCREVKDVKIIAAGGTSWRPRTSCPIEYVHPSDDELAELYSSCDVFVLPSFLEGMPVPPLEAMACGGAVVMTDCTGNRDYSLDGENCLVVPPRDPDSLAKAIVRALTDDALSERLRRNGPPTAAPWTYERMGRIFVDSIESG